MQSKSLSQQAYDRLESLIVTTALQPGARTTLGELERLCRLGRTPVHDAVKRLATARLILVHPRAGLTIAALDLEEQRVLLPVRIEMEAIACRLAAERADADDIRHLSAAAAVLRAGRDTMTLAELHRVDTELKAVILAASREMMLGNTLMPLQTLYRRSGWLFHAHVAPAGGLSALITALIDLLDAILGRDPAAAERQARTMLAEIYPVLALLQQRLPQHAVPANFV